MKLQRIQGIYDLTISGSEGTMLLRREEHAEAGDASATRPQLRRRGTGRMDLYIDNISVTYLYCCQATHKYVALR